MGALLVIDLGDGDAYAKAKKGAAQEGAEYRVLTEVEAFGGATDDAAGDSAEP